MLIQKIEVPDLPNEIGSLQVIKESDFDSLVAELLDRLSDSNRIKINYPSLGAKGYVPKRPTYFFVGRHKELKELFVDSYGFQGKTKKGVPIAISGLAGIGKTQLALEFAHRFNVFFSHGVYWVDMPNGIVQEFEKIGKELGIERLLEERPLEYANRVKERLSELNEGLVIFDNVTDIGEFRKWYPHGNRSCSVVLTTRKSPRGFAVRVMNLIDLDEEAAYQLVLSRRPDRDTIIINENQTKALKEICQIMGHHPLALELCASYLQDEFTNPVQFLSDLQQENPLDFMINQPEFHDLLLTGEANLFQMLLKNYQSLDTKLVDPYFLLMSCFASHGINSELIINAYYDPVSGKGALNELSKYSLIYHEANDRIYLHPLVAEFGKSLEKTKSENYNKKFVEVIMDFLHRHKDKLSLENTQIELPHIEKAREVSKQIGLWELSAQLHMYEADIVKGIDTQIDLLNGAYKIISDRLFDQKRQLPNLHVRIGKAHRKKGQPKEAIEAFEYAETLYATFPNVEPKEIAKLQFEIGNSYLALGKYALAGERLEHALNIAIKDASLDIIAPEVTQICQALAILDLFLGNYEDAEQQFIEILEHRLKFYNSRPEEASLEVSSSYGDLSRLALERGNYAVSTEYAKKARKVIVEHNKQAEPAYGELLLHIGEIHIQSGKFRLAQEHIEDSLESFKNTYGERHPSYARALIALGEVHRIRGYFAEALENIDLAIKIVEARYGDIHPFIADALEVRGKVYNHLNNSQKELKVWKRVETIQERIYSGDHPDLAKTHYNYGNLYLSRGQFIEAIHHLEESINITKESLGTNHVDYFGRIVRLAVCYYRQQNFPEAQQALNQAEDIIENIFPDPLHPLVARMYQLQSGIYRHRGQFDKAQDSIDRALEIKEEIYGRGHPSVAESIEKKVKILHHRGVGAEVKHLIDRALEIRANCYGIDHYEYSHSVHNLGSYYLRLGRYDAAIEQFEKAIQIVRSSLGNKHPEYIERSLNLGNAYYEKGEYDVALKIFRGLEKTVWETIAVTNHSLKARWLFGMGELYRRTGSFKKAADYVDGAIEMRRALYGEVHPSVAEALESRGHIFHHMGLFDKEESIWNELIIQNYYPENHPSLANAHYNYSNLFLRRSEFGEAINHLHESIKITENSLGREHSHYFRYLVRLARCHYELQNYNDAQKTLHQAEELLDNIFGESTHPFVARMHQLQSEIYRRLGRFRDALDSVDLAIEMKNEIYGDAHPSLAEALEVKVKVYHHMGKVEEAKELIDRALEIRKKSYGENHLEYSRSVQDLGSYYLRLGRYDEAIKQFEDAIRIVEAALGKKHPEYIEQVLHLANAYYEKGDYDGALNIVENLGSSIRDTITAKHHYLKALWLHQRADLHRRKGFFKKAMVFIEETISMRENLYGNLHPSVAEALMCKAKILGHMGQFDEEETIWTDILEIQRYIFPDNHPAIATTYYDYGNLFLNKGEFDKAAKFLELSKDITGKSLGKTHSYYFGRLVQWARCFYEQQNYSRAKDILYQVRDLRDEVFGMSPHPYIARMLQLQSEIDQQLGNVEEALENIDEAIKIKEAIYKDNHPSVAESLEIKVDLLLAQYQAHEAKGLLDRIDRIRSESYGKTHLRYADFQMRLAEFHLRLNDYDEAQHNLTQSLEVCRNKFKDDHPEIIKRQVSLAHLARIKGDIRTAEKHINEASKALGTRMDTEKSLIVSSVLIEASNIHHTKSEYQKAWSEIKKAFEIESEILGVQSPNVTELLIDKARLKVITNHVKEAEELLQVAFENTQDEERIYKSLKANALEQRSLLESSKKEVEQALDTINDAIILRKEVSGDESVELAKLFIEKASILRRNERYNEAITFLDRAQNIINPRFNPFHVYFGRILLENGWAQYEKRNFLLPLES